jgi:hypothetical protein
MTIHLFNVRGRGSMQVDARSSFEKVPNKDSPTFPTASIFAESEHAWVPTLCYVSTFVRN